MAKTLQIKEKREALLRQTFRAFYMEFIFLVIIALLSLIAQCLYAREAFLFKRKVASYIEITSTDRVLRPNKTISYCSGGSWTLENVKTSTERYTITVFFFLCFLGVAGIMCLVHGFIWVFYLFQIKKDPEYGKDHPRLTLVVRSLMGIIRNFAQDIPLSCLGTELFAQRRGRSGLACIVCALTPSCVNDKIVNDLLDPSSQCLTVLIMLIIFSSIWKGITTFFRWSHTAECAAVSLRGCAAIFVGVIYACIIIAPSLAIFRFQYLTLAGVNNSSLQGFIDKFLLVGLISWVAIFIVVVCCPLIHSIRLSDK